jgi:shikimate dehydrogenase
MKITAQTKICMVIGDPVGHSLSPQMHNTGYEALGIDNQFVYVACLVDVNVLENFVKGVRAMNIRGVSCTIPHKMAVMPYLDEIDEVAKKIGAVNTIVNDNRRLIGYNTDWLGILTPLEKITKLNGKTVAIIGAGGAARAAAYAVTSKRAKLAIYNRTLQKAKELSDEFGGVAFSLDMLENIANADIIINTTSVGLKNKNETVLPKKLISKNKIIFDAVYGDGTQLLKDAKEKGAQTIAGIEMLLHQGVEQFRLYTEHDAPIDVMRKVLL